jgi:hypothetical protein
MTRHGFPAANTPSGMSRGDDAARADDALRADPHAGANDRTAADPHVGADRDRLTELLPATQLRVERVGGGVDLHRRAEQGVVTDFDAANVEDDAVEIEEALLPQVNVRPVVAEERRLHPHVPSARAE